MKTKYIAVPVSERLPKDTNDVIVIDEHGQSGEAFFRKSEKWYVYNRDAVNGRIEFWLEEKEDHSEEMLSLLEDVKNKFKPSLSHPLEEGQEEFINQIEQLINKVKDNG
ncbi:hypothetical protein [Elizabethkingia anophelis]|uniref:hypothetical protein n=1 Tax=Elizabethkingia anophelis TaxID=1117645 RepID=UPI003891CBAD